MVITLTKVQRLSDNVMPSQKLDIYIIPITEGSDNIMGNNMERMYESGVSWITRGKQYLLAMTGPLQS